MTTKAGARPDTRRWQDIRARAMDAKFDADRRRVGERVAVSFRWLFLIVLAVLNNVTTVAGAEARGTVDILLAAWAVMNVVVNILLARGYQPGKQFSLTTMSLDIFFATGPYKALSRDTWATCDSVMAVSHARLDRVRIPFGRWSEEVLSADDLKRLASGLRHALGSPLDTD